MDAICVVAGAARLGGDDLGNVELSYRAWRYPTAIDGSLKLQQIRELPIHPVSVIVWPCGGTLLG